MNAVILSNALDTNGQNARYKVAADKHGTAVLKALAIGRSDPAGVVGRFQTAAGKHGGLSIRSVHRAAQYFEYPGDIVWTNKTKLTIQQLVDEADIVHLNNSYIAAQRFRVHKPMLLHHHGSLFRNNPEHMLGVARHYRMLQAVSTIDLTREAPELLHWLPTAYDVKALRGAAHRRPADGRIRVVHAPTNRALKHTELLLATIESLRAEGLPVDLDLIEGKTHAECMERKAQADIVFDQLAYGYGCNSVEAWAMGIPTVNGADDWTLQAMRKAWGGLPFDEATEDTLGSVLRRLITDPEHRAQVAARGHAHVLRYHDEKPALERLVELYIRAIEHYHRPRIVGKGTPVTFRNTRGRKVYLEDELVPFAKGTLTTDDPIVVARLRAFASTRPRYGIEEVAG